MRKMVEHVFCDCCKKEIAKAMLEIDYKEAHLEYCEDCADKMIFGVTEKQAEKKPEQKAKTCCAPARDPEVSVADMPEESEGGVAGKFDAGKAQALRDANWTVKKIAEEMKVCTATVYNNTHPAAPRKRKPLEFGG
ncbi:MAG: hypothetical protein Q4A04_10025 [Eubacteriales bacterium]|nr:hypothetical protein [Eubacteriales bacterium]